MQPARRRRPAAGGRISTRTSCGECRRRRQRCDQKQPCGRCARRYPQPICHYGEDHELDDVVLPEVSNLIQRETDALTVSYGQPTPVRYDDTQAFTKLMELAHRLPGALDDKDNEVLRVYIQLHDQHTSSLSVAREKRDPYQLDIIPMCVQTPLLSQIFIYLGACFLAEIGQLGQTKVYDCKGRAIHHLNEAIRNTQLTAKQEVIVAIILIINNELCYGNTQYLLVHIRGLRETIALCGGLDDLGMNGLLAKMAICSDLCTAFSFEAPPLLQDWQDATSLDAPEISFKWSHNTPLCTTLPDFSVCSELMRIHPITASILEEMRVLVRLVLDQSRDPTPHKAKKLKSTALWLQNRINEYPEHAPPRDIHTPPPSDIISRSSSRSKSGSPQPIIPIPTTDLPGDPSPDYVYQCARRVSLLFCRAVIRRKPLKDVIQPHDLLALWASMWRVSLDQWGSILGIFVWIQTTTASATQLMPPCAAVKSMFPVSMLQLAQENWSVAKEVFANTLQIHEWLGSGPDDDDAREDNSV